MNYDVAADAYRELKISATTYSENGEHGQAYILSTVLLNVNPGDAEVQALRRQALKAEPELKRFDKRWIMGSNLALTEKRHLHELSRILLYPFTLALDLIDVATLEVGACVGVGAKIQATDFAALGGQFSIGEATVGIHHGHLSIKAAIENYVDILPWETRGLIETRVGTGELYCLPYAQCGFKHPGRLIYLHARDFWAIGGQLNLIVFSVNLKAHPIQMWDFIAGIFFQDPLSDNLGAARHYDFNRDDVKNVRSLILYEQNK